MAKTCPAISDIRNRATTGGFQCRIFSAFSWRWNNKNFITVADAKIRAGPIRRTFHSPPSPAPAAPFSHLDFDPISFRHHTDGWTREKQRWFIEELADCGIVREAAARKGYKPARSTGCRLSRLSA